MSVTAKLTNNGVNQANYPTSLGEYGSIYQTQSASYTFYDNVNFPIPNVLTVS